MFCSDVTGRTTPPGNQIWKHIQIARMLFDESQCAVEKMYWIWILIAEEMHVIKLLFHFAIKCLFLQKKYVPLKE